MDKKIKSNLGLLLCAWSSFTDSQSSACRGSRRGQFLLRNGCLAWACIDATPHMRIWGASHTAGLPAWGHWLLPIHNIPVKQPLPQPCQKSMPSRAQGHTSPLSNQKMRPAFASVSNSISFFGSNDPAQKDSRQTDCLGRVSNRDFSRLQQTGSQKPRDSEWCSSGRYASRAEQNNGSGGINL